MKKYFAVLIINLMCVISVFSADASAASTNVMPAYLESSWEKLRSTLAKTLSLHDNHESLPDSAFIGEDKRSNAKKINKLLDQATDILLHGNANDLRKQAIKLRTEIPALQLEIDDLRNKRISAPESSKNPLVKTRSKIDKRIAEIPNEIKAKEKALADIKSEVVEVLREMGLDMDYDQVDFLLTSVSGDDFFQYAIVFTNVKHVVGRLETLSLEDRDNLETARRYTGMYLVLNDLLIAMQEGLVDKIDKDYKPRLADMRSEAEGLLKQSEESARQLQYDENQRRIFQANAQTNRMTIRVAKLYAEVLDSERNNALDTLVDLRRNRNVVENTYKTIRSSGDLRSLIRSGLDLFDTLQAMKMPKIQPFESDALRKELEEINKRLKK